MRKFLSSLPLLLHLIVLHAGSVRRRSHHYRRRSSSPPRAAQVLMAAGADRRDTRCRSLQASASQTLFTPLRRHAPAFFDCPIWLHRRAVRYRLLHDITIAFSILPLQRAPTSAARYRSRLQQQKSATFFDARHWRRFYHYGEECLSS